MTTNSNIRPIAFYLPQFHPIPENDEWWGKGFTEWTNVVKAKPLFRGHYQPHLPADLGFYDLRLPELRQAQADLAKKYGIYGFCYYHYWFNGRRLLERPINEVLSSGKPDFPFCLCWANESWTRRWDGFNQEVLIEQTYGGESDAQNHFLCLLNMFKDVRYICVNGKPLFLIYRAKQIPDITKILRTWREESARAGLPGLYICSVDSSWSRNWDPTPYGFDAAVEFQPAFTIVPPDIIEHFGLRLKIWPWRQRPKHKIILYRNLVNYMLQRQYPPYKMFRCVTPGFDNTSRRKYFPASILHQSNPEDFGRWLNYSVECTRKHMQGDERIVFINAWNEWAEGNHLEPDLSFRHTYLEQIVNAIAV